MVTYTGGPSPKRRRTDAPPTAQDVANTNRTLQAFTGARQNRWMQIGPDGEEGATMAPASNETWNNAASASERARQVNRSATADNASLPSITSGQSRASPGNAREPINLVDYESPYTMDFSTNAHHSDKRPQPVSRTMSQPGLPSPAPSLENRQSPAATNTAEHPGFRTSISGQTRGMGSRRSLGITTTTGVSPAQSARVSMPATSAPGQLSSGPHSHVSTSTAPTPILRSNGTPRMTSQSPLYAQPFNSPAQHPPPRPNYYSQPYMQNQMEALFAKHQSRPSGYDDGRKMLLRDAVQTNDLFYLVLSQIFCLRSTHPEHLPTLMSIVPSASFSALERLLCANQEIDAELVGIFAQFPAPVQLMYASESNLAFVQTLDAVQAFLIRLPQTWPAMLEESKRLQAPPLAQDMVERLQLTSPVLQMTAFRAIARHFWTSLHNRGLQILDSLHQIDQDTYFLRQWRRTETEKRIARDVYVKVFRSFMEFCRQGKDPALYIAPAEVSYFQSPPPSMLRQAGIAMNQGNMLAMQQQHQQQKMMANHAALANQYQLPGQLQQILQGSHSHARTPSATLLSHPAGPLAPNPPAHLSRILPRENSMPRAQPVHPDTTRMALHQAHLRSPAPGPKTLPPNAQPLYRHVIGYAVNLTRINPRMHAQTIPFAISEDNYSRIPTTVPSKLPGEPGKRYLDEFSYLYRLRCSQIPQEGFSDENTWVTADNVWPDNLVADLNGKHLEPRRKLHHGRYLPIDLTSHLQSGRNALNIFLNRRTDDTRPFEYAVAIEIVGVKTHSRLLSIIPTISSTDSLAAIKQSLSGSSNDDDDIVMTSSVLTIGLFDPFTNAQICRIPVRGKTCLHRDCFDLETFLSQCKREKPGYPTTVDCWRCPLCKSDVRPQSMIKDGFLMEVRDELEKKGLLETRAIIVNEDGSWWPKAEEQATGVRSASLEREEAAAAAQRARPKRPIEVIELD